MTDINPDDYGPTLPLLEPCGCPIRQGHACRPSFMTEDEWTRCNCILGDQHYKGDHPVVKS